MAAEVLTWSYLSTPARYSIEEERRLERDPLNEVMTAGGDILRKSVSLQTKLILWLPGVW